MRRALDETNRRRKIQQDYNDAHGITPQTIKKAVRDLISISKEVKKDDTLYAEKDIESMSKKELEKLAAQIQKKMKAAAAELNFEEAVVLRDQMIEVKKLLNDL
jgi:excinuclease ABC subunit B